MHSVHTYQTVLKIVFQANRTKRNVFYSNINIYILIRMFNILHEDAFTILNPNLDFKHGFGHQSHQCSSNIYVTTFDNKTVISFVPGLRARNI